MAKLSPWSVKGIDGKTREIARTAARESGLTIGEWINRTILENTGNMAGAAAALVPAPDAGTPGPGTTESGGGAPPKTAPGPRTVDDGLGIPPAATEPPATDLFPETETGSPETEAGQMETPTPGTGTPETLSGDAAPESADTIPEPQVTKARETPSEDQHSHIGGTPADNDRGSGIGEPAPVRPAGHPDEGLGASAAQLAPGLAAGHARPPEPPRLIRNLAVASVVFVAALAVIWAIDWGDEPAPTGTPEAARTEPAVPEEARTGTPKQGTPATAGATGRTKSPEKGPPARLGQLTALARNGDARAQYDLGVLHVRGSGVAKDEKLAASWFRKAALQGIAEAQYNMGVLREQGSGLPKDEKLAFFWYLSAAEQNHVRAQYNLGVMYAEGRGTPRNYLESRKWFTKAAESRLAAAQYSLGTLYEHGFGGPVDRVAANRWYRRAADGGNALATAKLDKFSNRPPTVTSPKPDMPTSPKSTVITVSKRLSPQNIAEIQGFLTRLNFDPGPSDSVAGDRTIAAIRLYQQFAGLPVDGAPSAELLRDLRQVVDAMASPQR